MAQVISSIARPSAGSILQVMEVAGHGGKGYYRPGMIILVEIQAGTEFTQRNRKNVISAVDVGEFNLASTRGPRSRYVMLVEAANQRLAAAIIHPVAEA